MRKYLKSGHVLAKFIALKVKGDSMYPKYFEGDTVIIEVTLIAIMVKTRSTSMVTMLP